MHKSREGQDRQEGKRGVNGKEEEQVPLSCAPPLPSQKALTCEGGGADDGRG